MNNKISRFGVFLIAVGALGLNAACEAPPPPPQSSAPVTNTNTAVAVNSPAPSPAASPANNSGAMNAAVTLPVLDAMFAEDNFAADLKSKIGLSDEQIEKLKTTARESTANLEENDNGSTNSAVQTANEQIRGIVGADKAQQLARFVNDRYENGAGENAPVVGANKPNSIPTDTRIVVNAPAYRMDVFRDGKLLKTYKVGIGYPEFPLPTGTRRAENIIFNPTWTPPDEPWVKGKVAPGRKVEAGSKLNPLGPIKIPIGSPSLIHGGKQPAKLGGFASHGCVGLTDKQVKEFAATLAQLSNTEIKPEDLIKYEKDKTETKTVKLASAIPVELRYETIVVEDGKLHIYRDVYERGTNTEENLRKVLDANGVSFDSLSEAERAAALNALQQMARDPAGNPVDANANNSNNNANGNANGNANANNKNGSNNKNANANVKETRTIKGAKDVTVDVAALKGKGFPAPVNLSQS